MVGVHLLLFPIIGAVIGALTNQIAIKMLFHPYRAWMVGPWRIPMTPGLIPQQRTTIASNIAATFDTNLLSGDDIHAILMGDNAHAAMAKTVDDLLAQLGPMAAMAQPFKPKIIDAILTGLERYIKEAIADGGDLDIRQKIESRINAMDVATLEELVMGFSRRQFRYITIFGGILGAIIGTVQAGLSIVLST